MYFFDLDKYIFMVHYFDENGLRKISNLFYLSSNFYLSL